MPSIRPFKELQIIYARYFRLLRQGEGQHKKTKQENESKAFEKHRKTKISLLAAVRTTDVFRTSLNILLVAR